MVAPNDFGYDTLVVTLIGTLKLYSSRENEQGNFFFEIGESGCSRAHMVKRKKNLPRQFWIMKLPIMMTMITLAYKEIEASTKIPVFC